MNALASIMFFTLFSVPFLAGAAQARPPSTVVKVNAAYSADSLWTEDEIRQRLLFTKQVYLRACPGLEIELAELVRVEDSDLQDIEGFLTVSSVGQMKRILGKFRQNVRPTILYVRRAQFEGTDRLSEFPAQAYTLGGPRPLAQFQNYRWNQFTFDVADPLPFTQGNLEWRRLEELRPIHGVAMISQGSSRFHADRTGETREQIYSTDAHELGHILLNDESHRGTDGNIMSAGPRLNFDSDQCELARAYYEQEALRDTAVRDGILRLCAYVHQNILGDPGFCSTGGQR